MEFFRVVVVVVFTFTMFLRPTKSADESPNDSIMDHIIRLQNAMMSVKQEISQLVKHDHQVDENVEKIAKGSSHLFPRFRILKKLHFTRNRCMCRYYYLTSFSISGASVCLSWE